MTQKTFLKIGLVFCLFFAGFVSINSVKAQANLVIIQEVKDTASILLEISDEIKAVPRELKKDPAVEQAISKAVGKAQEVAEKRKKLVLKIIQEDPDDIVKVAVSEEARSRMLEEIRDEFERKVSKVGELETLIIENFEKTENIKIKHFIIGEKQEKTEIFASQLPRTLSSTKIQISGYELYDNIAVENPSQNLTVISEPLKIDPTDLKLAVILLNNPELPVPASKDEIKQIFFENPHSVNNYYLENSYGSMGVQGDVYGWFDFPDESVSPFLVADSEVNFLNYNRFVFIYNAKPEDVIANGSAILGVRILKTPDGSVTGSIVWITTTKDQIPGTAIHELGHTLGLEHAAAWECAQAVNDIYVGENLENPMEGCDILPYGDQYDVMGRSKGQRHFSAAHKVKIGWSINTKVVSKSDIDKTSYSIYPLELPSSNIQHLKIPIKNSLGREIAFYSVEYRKPVGFDSIQRTGSNSIPEMVIVRLVPVIETDSDVFLPGDTLLPLVYSSEPKILLVGDEFEDPYRNVRIAFFSQDEQSATVRVSNVQPTSSISFRFVSTPPVGTKYFSGSKTEKIATLELTAGERDVEIYGLEMTLVYDQSLIAGLSPLKNPIIQMQNGGLGTVTNILVSGNEYIIKFRFSVPVFILAKTSRELYLFGDVNSELDKEYTLYVQLRSVVALEAHQSGNIMIMPPLPFYENWRTVTLAKSVVAEPPPTSTPTPTPTPSPTPVLNAFPVANAGSDKRFTGKSFSTYLDGSGSYDLDHDPLNYQWSEVQTGSQCCITISNPNIVNPLVSFNFTGISFTEDLIFTLKLVVADDKGGSDEDTVNIILLPDNIPPAEVSNLSLTADSKKREATLKWTNPIESDFVGVRILKKTTGVPTGYADGETIYIGTGTSFTDTPLIYGTSYYYKIFTYDGIPNYSTGQQVVVTIQNPSPASISNFIVAKGVSNGEITASWINPNDPDLKGVRFVYRTDGKQVFSVSDGMELGDKIGMPGQSNNAIWTGLDPETDYSITGFAYDVDLNFSPGVTIIMAPRDLTAPSEIANFTVQPGSRNEEITANWIYSPNKDLLGVMFRYRTDGTFPNSPTDGELLDYQFGTPGSSGSAVWKDDPEKIFYIRAFSYDTDYNFSSGVNANKSLKPTDLTPPSPVYGLSAIEGDSQILLSWQNPSDSDFAGVKILRKTGAYPTNPNDGITIYTGKITTFTDVGLNNGTPYYYSVFAYDEVPNYSVGAQKTQTPRVLTYKIYKLQASNIAATQATISWDTDGTTVSSIEFDWRGGDPDYKPLSTLISYPVIDYSLYSTFQVVGYRSVSRFKIKYSDFRTSYEQLIQNLKPATNYVMKIKSVSTTGVEDIQKVNLTTSPPSINNPISIIPNVNVTQTSLTTARISWTTSSAGYAVAELTDNSTGDTLLFVKFGNTTSHQLELQGLKTGRIYNFYVYTYYPNGTRSESAKNSFLMQNISSSVPFFQRTASFIEAINNFFSQEWIKE